MKHGAGLFCDGNLQKRFICVTAHLPSPTSRGGAREEGAKSEAKRSQALSSGAKRTQSSPEAQLPNPGAAAAAAAAGGPGARRGAKINGGEDVKPFDFWKHNQRDWWVHWRDAFALPNLPHPAHSVVGVVVAVGFVIVYSFPFAVRHIANERREGDSGIQAKIYRVNLHYNPCGKHTQSTFIFYIMSWIKCIFQHVYKSIAK